MVNYVLKKRHSCSVVNGLQINLQINDKLLQSQQNATRSYCTELLNHGN